MDPEIQRALAAGYTPQQIAAELQRRGLAVPPELTSIMNAPAPQAADATRTPVPAAVQQMQPTYPDALAAAAPTAAAGAALGAGVYGGAKLTNRVLPKTVAERRIGRAVQQSGGVEPLLRELQNYEQAGRGDIVTLGDLSVPLGEQGADFTATRNERARTSLLQLHRDRQRGVPARLLGDVKELVPGGYSSADFLINLSKQSQRDFAAGPTGFQGLRDANPAINPAEAPRLATFIESPRLEKLWRDAADVAGLGPKPKADALSFETLQDLKERLDDATDVAFRTGRGNLGDRLRSARDELVDILSKAVPGYEQVAAQYAQFAQHQTAVEAGLEAWNNHAIQLPDLARQIADMTPEQRAAFQRGMVSGYVRDIENARTNRNLANEMMSRSAILQRKLEIVFGNQQNFEEAVKRFGLEASMNRMGQYVGGSATARRLSAPGTDVGEAVVEAGAHTPHRGIYYSTLGKIPEFHAERVASRMEPYFTATGSDAVRSLLERIARLPK